MTETCSHPKGALVVPETVVPVFETAILPRERASVIEKPHTIGGYIKKISCKASAVVSPVLAVGSFSGYISIADANPNPDLLMLVSVTVGSLAAMFAGCFGTVNSFISLKNGDRKYFPLPATKQYLENESNKQKALIAPFNEWDNIFANNDDRMQKMLTPGK